jgi:hypothetical protein
LGCRCGDVAFSKKIARICELLGVTSQLIEKLLFLKMVIVLRRREIASLLNVTIVLNSSILMGCVVVLAIKTSFLARLP